MDRCRRAGGTQPVQFPLVFGATDRSQTCRKAFGIVSGVKKCGDEYRMSDRTALQIAILELVEKAAAEGSVIDVKLAGTWLVTHYPRSGFNIEDIHRRIERIAIQKHAAVNSDGLRQNA